MRQAVFVIVSAPNGEEVPRMLSLVTLLLLTSPDWMHDHHAQFHGGANSSFERAAEAQAEQQMEAAASAHQHRIDFLMERIASQLFEQTTRAEVDAVIRRTNRPRPDTDLKAEVTKLQQEFAERQKKEKASAAVSSGNKPKPDGERPKPKVTKLQAKSADEAKTEAAKEQERRGDEPEPSTDRPKESVTEFQKEPLVKAKKKAAKAKAEARKASTPQPNVDREAVQEAVSLSTKRRSGKRGALQSELQQQTGEKQAQKPKKKSAGLSGGGQASVSAMALAKGSKAVTDSRAKRAQLKAEVAKGQVIPAQAAAMQQRAALGPNRASEKRMQLRGDLQTKAVEPGEGGRAVGEEQWDPASQWTASSEARSKEHRSMHEFEDWRQLIDKARGNEVVRALCRRASRCAVHRVNPKDEGAGDAEVPQVHVIEGEADSITIRGKTYSRKEIEEMSDEELKRLLFPAFKRGPAIDHQEVSDSAKAGKYGLLAVSIFVGPPGSRVANGARWGIKVIWTGAKAAPKRALAAVKKLFGSGGGNAAVNTGTKLRPLARSLGAAGDDALLKKAVNSNLPHAASRAVERGVFKTAESASAGLKELTQQITKSGTFPNGTLVDTARKGRFLVPVGNNGMAVYQLAKNGTAKLKTVLIAR